MKTCIYCGNAKPDADFSDEHIWPDALGGDYLPKDLWRTDEVCINCNSMSGVYVDGSFIKSWMGANERSHGALGYLSPTRPGALPLDYLGRIKGAVVDADEIAELWSGPCGANIVHVRPDDKEEHWASYAGGDPRSKKSAAGQAYIALTTTDPFWIWVSLLSFVAHFRKAPKYVTNMNVDPSWTKLSNADPGDPVQTKGIETLAAIRAATGRGEFTQLQAVIDLNIGTRMLAKLALALGYKLFGPSFLASPYGIDLRRGFREGNSDKRSAIPIRGSGFLTPAVSPQLNETMSWPGGWVLLLVRHEARLTLSVYSPSGQAMQVMVTDDAAFTSALDASYDEGVVWLTVPPAAQAVGPLALPDYLAHRTGGQSHTGLAAIEALRTDPAELLPCSGT